MRYSWTVLGALMLTLPCMASAAANKKHESHQAPVANKKTAPTPEAPRATPANLNPITQAAANVGVSGCLERMNQVTTFVASNSKNGALLFLAPSEPDAHVASVSMEVLAPNALSYVDTQFTPNRDTTCGGAYEAVTYWANSCQEVATSAFSSFKVSKPLRQSIAVLDGGQSVRVFLMPAGQGCISIKKEVLY